MLSIIAAIAVALMLDDILANTRLFGLHIVGNARSNLIISIFALTFFVCAAGIIIKSSNGSKLKYSKKSPRASKINKNVYRRKGWDKLPKNQLGENGKKNKDTPRESVFETMQKGTESKKEELDYRVKENAASTKRSQTELNSVVSVVEANENEASKKEIKTELNLEANKAEGNKAQRERLKAHILNFLNEALEGSQTEKATMDNFNKFGVSLYLAGACEIMSQNKQYNINDKSKALAEVVQIMGFKKSHAASFSTKYEEYLMADSRYMLMFQAGRNAINIISSEKDSGPRLFKNAMAEWNKPKSRGSQAGPITVLFTDIVDSTALTQSLGDSDAQKMVRAHNRVVREALNIHSGKEIKHTGDGIMASFSSTSNAVEGAIHMQMETMKHNQVNPALPLHLKIGINTGEPISEDDDLFGTVVQLSARIVDKATADKIYVSETVYGMCAGKSYEFKNLGGFTMKGFENDITLFEVIW